MDMRTVGSLYTTATQDIARSHASWRPHKLFWVRSEHMCPRATHSSSLQSLGKKYDTGWG
jgi:hypothetical protein